MRRKGSGMVGARQSVTGKVSGDLGGGAKITGPQSVPGPQVPRGIYEGGASLSKKSLVEKLPNHDELPREFGVGEGVAE